MAVITRVGEVWFSRGRNWNKVQQDTRFGMRFCKVKVDNIFLDITLKQVKVCACVLGNYPGCIALRREGE